MARNKKEIRILVVTDDPSAPRELVQLLGEDSGARTLFSDTSNAVSRTFEDESVDMVVIQLDRNDLELFDLTCQLAHDSNPPIPVLAIIRADDSQCALRVADRSAEGIVLATNPRQIKRLALFMLESVRARRDASSAVRRLEEIEERYTLLLDSSSEAIAYIHEGLHIYANRAYLNLFDYADFAELEGLSMLDLLAAEDGATDLKKILKDLARDEMPDQAITLKAVRQDGSEFLATVDFSPARYGGENCAQMLVREQVSAADPALSAELEKLKTVDLVTGLLNRGAFLDRITLETSSRDDTSSLCLVLCSLDKHNELQSKVGLGASDDLIRETAGLFSEAAGEVMAMGRLSDHSFGLLADVDSRETAEAIAARIVDHCSGRILDIRDTSLTVSASAGLALAGSDAPSADVLVGQADIALSEALHAGGNAYVRYRPRISADGNEDDAVWEEKLRHALDHDEFRLVTSPITSMDDDEFQINEVETRLRSEGSDEVLMPSVYLPAAMKLGMAVRLDQDMIRRLVASLSERRGSVGHHWLVPLCVDTIGEQSAVHQLANLLKQNDIEPSRLIWGLREPEIRDKLRRAQSFIEIFKPMGTRFALCDVGPESDIEPLLKHLDIDFIRLAAEMVQNMSGNDTLRKQLAEMAELGSQHHVRVISPKVEHTGDLATLWQFGITLVQGDFVREEASV
ncbi:MAG: EAL domain-containing protein [Wenzhouxiangella sp.]